MRSRSSSLRTIVSRSWPIMTRSRADSKSSMPMVAECRRTACRAASLTRLARSAPLMPGRAARHHGEVDRGVEGLVLGVDLEDGQALVEVGQGHHDLAVEAARAQQRRVEHVGPVGRGHDHDALGGLEAVHLVEHLVEGLLALVVAAAEPGAALAADRVDLVDEDDRRGLLARGGEEVAHAARAHADEHLHEVRARHREEGHAGLAGDGARQHRLAGARRADEEDPLGDQSRRSPCSAPGFFRNSTTSLISCLTPR